jgi:hypothetical protein
VEAFATTQVIALRDAFLTAWQRYRAALDAVAAAGSPDAAADRRKGGGRPRRQGPGPLRRPDLPGPPDGGDLRELPGSRGRGFPVQRVAIGRDLQLVEQVTGRMNYGQAALRGAAQGAVLGLLLHAMTGGRRDFASVSGMRASRRHLQVDDEAARLLA